MARSDVAAALQTVTDQLPPVPLDAVLDAAALATRIDRKYLVPPALFERIATEVTDELSVLEIDGLRSFRYDTIYFDTPRFDSYLDGAHDRRRRFKIRTRSYLDSDRCQLEIKQTSGRGETVKVCMPYDVDDRHRLTADAMAFIGEHLAVPVPRDLAETLTTSYRRATLIDFESGARVTCDADLAMIDPDGRRVGLDGRVLVETKSTGVSTGVDRLLWANRCRPVSISKFSVGMALLHPGLPANKWNRTLREAFEWTPIRPHAAAGQCAR